jgi:hypothetical protein
MLYGTAYFESFNAAYAYYKLYGFNKVDVQLKLKEKEIFIGKPELKEDEFLSVNTSEGRYIIIYPDWFEMQVKLEGEWKSVKPSDSEKPYRFNTRLEAETSLKMCYPDQCLIEGNTEVRVKPFYC